MQQASAFRTLTWHAKGANSPLGIGRATAHQYAESGAKAIYICDFDDTHLESHKKEINAAFPSVEVHTRQCDVSDEKKVKAVVDDALAKYKRLDIFFANAGIAGKHAMFTEYDDSEFMDVMRVNTLRYDKSCANLLDANGPNMTLPASSSPPSTPPRP